jgi:hypothetical protein
MFTIVTPRVHLATLTKQRLFPQAQRPRCHPLYCSVKESDKSAKFEHINSFINNYRSKIITVGLEAKLVITCFLDYITTLSKQAVLEKHFPDVAF